MYKHCISHIVAASNSCPMFGNQIVIYCGNQTGYCRGNIVNNCEAGNLPAEIRKDRDRIVVFRRVLRWFDKNEIANSNCLYLFQHIY